jgi:hypothetical protein
VNLEDELPGARPLGVLQPLLPSVQLRSSVVVYPPFVLEAATVPSF